VVKGFAVDASLIKADANLQSGVPHVPVFDKSQRTDATLSRDDFSYDQEKGHQPCCISIFIPLTTVRTSLARDELMHVCETPGVAAASKPHR